MENKTSKYFKYALGEIILVVFGILIALQINNLNESRKATNEETKILNALQADFKASKTRIIETMRKQQIVLNHSGTLINIHERQDEKEFEYFDTHLDSLDQLISYGTAWYRAEPVTGAYNALINAGKIDLLKNETLRHILAQFSADLESGFEDQQNAMNLLTTLNNETRNIILKIASDKYRGPLQINSRKIDTLKISNAFFKNSSFFGTLYDKSVLELIRHKRQQNMLDHINSILSLIDEDIEG